MRRIFILLVLLPLLSGCGGGLREKNTKHKTKTKAYKSVKYKKNKKDLVMPDEYVKKDEKTKFFDEDVEAFVLEEDMDFNLFSEDKGVTLSQNKSGEFEIKSSDDDIDFSWIEDEDINKLNPIYFDFNKYGLKEEEKQSLKHNISKMGDMLKKDKNSIIVCEGHTCLYGSAVYNLGLSEKRSHFVAEILVLNGIPRERIKSVGRGKEMPIILGGNKEEQTPNRRVEIFTLAS